MRSRAAWRRVSRTLMPHVVSRLRVLVASGTCQFVPTGTCFNPGGLYVASGADGAGMRGGDILLVCGGDDCTVGRVAFWWLGKRGNVEAAVPLLWAAVWMIGKFARL